MLLQCDSGEAAKEIAEEHVGAIQAQGLLIEVVENTVIVSGEPESLAQAATNQFFLFGRQNIFYEKEVD